MKYFVIKRNKNVTSEQDKSFFPKRLSVTDLKNLTLQKLKTFIIEANPSNPFKITYNPLILRNLKPERIYKGFA